MGQVAKRINLFFGMADRLFFFGCSTESTPTSYPVLYIQDLLLLLQMGWEGVPTAVTKFRGTVN
jgi:hypothetical protein